MILPKCCFLSAFGRKFCEIVLKYCLTLTQNRKFRLSVVNGTPGDLFLACNSPHRPQEHEK